MLHEPSWLAPARARGRSPARLPWLQALVYCPLLLLLAKRVAGAAEAFQGLLVIIFEPCPDCCHAPSSSRFPSSSRQDSHTACALLITVLLSHKHKCRPSAAWPGVPLPFSLPCPAAPRILAAPPAARLVCIASPAVKANSCWGPGPATGPACGASSSALSALSVPHPHGGYARARCQQMRAPRYAHAPQTLLTSRTPLVPCVSAGHRRCSARSVGRWRAACSAAPDNCSCGFT